MEENTEHTDQVPGVIAGDGGIEPTGPSATVDGEEVALADDQGAEADLSDVDVER